MAIGATMILSGCQSKSPPESISCEMKSATSLFLPDQGFIGDAPNKSALNSAIDRSIVYLQSQEDSVEHTICGKQYSNQWLLESLFTFKDIIEKESSESVEQVVAQHFEVCQAINSKGSDQILVTAYYQPRLKGSLEKKPPYIYPLYKLPPDLITGSKVSDNTQPLVGRLEDNRYVPYYSRSQIETNNVLAGSELLYLADPFDAFVLHVQGSGLVELTDGSLMQVQYAGSNGLAYRSIGRLLVDEGRIPLEDINLPAIRSYLRQNNDQAERILHYNERFIFFKLAKADNQLNPVGSMGQPLTPGHSVALDPACFPLGGLYYLQTETPQFDSGKINGWQSIDRFVLHQDSGAAIKGSGRLDLFLGNSSYAEAAAGLMKQPGQLYMLVKKKISPQNNRM